MGEVKVFKFSILSISFVIVILGKVIRADIKTDEKNRSKGCGTVTFENSSDVTRAIGKFLQPSFSWDIQA